MFVRFGQAFSTHNGIRHGQKEFVRGLVQNNTAESFQAVPKRAEREGYHWMSWQHLPLYAAKAGFYWNPCKAENIVARKGKRQGTALTVIKRLSIPEEFKNPSRLAPVCKVRWTKNSGIQIFPTRSRCSGYGSVKLRSL